MTRISKPDTPADIEVRDCLDRIPPQSFIVDAGAGSGKTTSLVKALHHVLQSRGEVLRREGKKVACVTYTEVAAEIIAQELGNNPSVHVSTIHSFLWNMIAPYQSDLRTWVSDRLRTRIAEAQERLLKPRTRQSTRDKLAIDIERDEITLTMLKDIERFTYSSGGRYAHGELGHADVVQAGIDLLSNRAALCQIIASRFPVIFVDEYQDTDKEVVKAIKRIGEVAGNKLTLGFFGDRMQQIYLSGGPVIPQDGWREIRKPENYRSSHAVLNIVNSICISGAGETQVAGRGDNTINGCARFFIAPRIDRTDALKLVRKKMYEVTDDGAWSFGAPEDADTVKYLLLVHKGVAKLLGFEALWESLSGVFDEGLRELRLDSKSTWSRLWPVLPIVEFVRPVLRAYRMGKHHVVMNLMRQHSPALQDARRFSGTEARSTYPQRLKEVGQQLAAIIENIDTDENPKVGEVLVRLHEDRLYNLSDKLASYLKLFEQESGAGSDSSEGTDEEDTEKELAAMRAFWHVPIAEVMAFLESKNVDAPYQTQHSSKGDEFDRVLVLLDDEDGYNLYKYEKLLGIEPLSKTDEENEADPEKDSVLSRTRRLLYVCCSRAKKDLAVLLLTKNPGTAVESIKASGIFPPEAIEVLNVD